MKHKRVQRGVHKHKKGFTLVEVSLFLAITGLLFVGIVLGTNQSLFGQRFLDSTENYAEFLRSIYSEVSNTQSVGEGRSETAIYGKLISFGQRCGLDGTLLNGGGACNTDDGTSQILNQNIYVYDVVGDVAGADETSGSVIQMLKTLHANVIFKARRADNTIERFDPAGIVETYTPRWNATIETTNLAAYTPYTGSILVVRHPRSGTINTLVSDEIINVNAYVTAANASLSAGSAPNVDNFLTDKLDAFSLKEVDFCIDPEGLESMGAVEGTLRERRDIRLVENARNASGVEVIDLNDYYAGDDGLRNKCMPEKDEN